MNDRKIAIVLWTNAPHYAQHYTQIFLSSILTSLLILLVYEHLLVPLQYEIPCTKELFTK